MTRAADGASAVQELDFSSLRVQLGPLPAVSLRCLLFHLSECPSVFCCVYYLLLSCIMICLTVLSDFAVHWCSCNVGKVKDHISETFKWGSIFEMCYRCYDYFYDFLFSFLNYFYILPWNPEIFIFLERWLCQVIWRPESLIQQFLGLEIIGVNLDRVSFLFSKYSAIIDILLALVPAHPIGCIVGYFVLEFECIGNLAYLPVFCESMKIVFTIRLCC